jgi:hypothetical protein
MRRDQDLVEYAMLAAFVAVMVGSFIPVATSKIGIILSQLFPKRGLEQRQSAGRFH